MRRFAIGAGALSASFGFAWAQVETVRLDESAFATGTLTAAEGALPEDLWAGADAETVGALLAALPERFEEPAYFDLARRVLLSPGEGPDGADNALAGEKLLAAARIGFPREAAGLAETAPGVASEPALSQAIAYAALLDGDMNAACSRGARLREGRQAPFFLKLRLLCYAHTGEDQAADLTLGLLEDQGALSESDERVFTALTTSGSLGASVSPRDAFQYAAARMLGAEVTPAALSEVPGGVLVAVARDQDAPQDLRLPAIERALSLGLIGPEEGRELIGALPGSDIAEELVAVFGQQSGSSEQAGAMASSLRRARDLTGFTARAALYEPLIIRMLPLMGNTSEAEELAYGAFALGRTAPVEAWLRKVEGRVQTASEPDTGGVRALLEVPPTRPPLTDPLAEAPLDTAELVALALSAARSGSEGSAALAALTGLGTEADRSAEPIREAVIAEMLSQSGQMETIGTQIARREALSAVLSFSNDAADGGSPMPRLKPSGR